MKSPEIAMMWRRAFGDVVPVGFLCRAGLPSRWLRIHSLPGSKRYPDHEAEYQELLRRHNHVATTLLGEGEECLLFVATLGQQPGSPSEPEVPSLDAAAFFRVPELLVPETAEDPEVEVAVTIVSWHANRFDPLITAVADGRAGPVLFANCDRRAAYAPYDGGADLFLDSPERVAQMKITWTNWSSPRHDGL